MFMLYCYIFPFRQESIFSFIFFILFNVDFNFFFISYLFIFFLFFHVFFHISFSAKYFVIFAIHIVLIFFICGINLHDGVFASLQCLNPGQH